MFGYGIGMGGAGGAGVLQTSGNTMLIPPLPLWASPRKLTNVVWPMLPPLRRRHCHGSPCAVVGRGVHECRASPETFLDAECGKADHQRTTRGAGVAVAVSGVVHAVLGGER